MRNPRATKGVASLNFWGVRGCPTKTFLFVTCFFTNRATYWTQDHPITAFAVRNDRPITVFAVRNDRPITVFAVRNGKSSRMGGGPGVKIPG